MKPLNIALIGILFAFPIFYFSKKQNFNDYKKQIKKYGLKLEENKVTTEGG